MSEEAKDALQAVITKLEALHADIESGGVTPSDMADELAKARDALNFLRNSVETQSSRR